MKSSYDLFREASDRFPKSHLFFPGEDRHYSYKEFIVLIDKAAKALSAMGIGYGDKVSIMGHNSSYFLTMLFATIKVGAIVIPINAKYLEEDVFYMVNAAKVKLMCFLSDTPIYEKVARSVPAIITLSNFDSFITSAESMPDSESCCNNIQYILFTSGTTSHPKGVQLSLENVLNSTKAYIDNLKVDKDEVMLLDLPLSYCYGSVLLSCSFFQVGASLVVSKMFTVRGALAAIEKYHCTFLNMVPTMCQLIFQSGLMERYDTSSVRKIGVGGSFVSPELMDAIAANFKTTDIICAYGLTESTSYAISPSLDDPFEERRVFVGRPTLNMEARIVSEDGSILGCDEPGELCLRGSGMMIGYLDESQTATMYDLDGWFHTGDVALAHSNGMYSIVGRCKDMIIKGGENISPMQIERVIDNYEGISGSQVVGVIDPVFGEKVVAVITKSQAADIDIRQLINYLKINLSINKQPDYYVAVDSLPFTTSGKISKQNLRNLVNDKFENLKRNQIVYLQ